jgi:hypothetical protein
MAIATPRPRQLSQPILILIFTILTAFSYLIWITFLGQQSEGPTSEAPTVKSERPPYDLAYMDDPIYRLSLNDIGCENEVYCWPSVGGIIVASKLTPVELDFISLPRFNELLRPKPNSGNSITEDAFCHRLRLTGAKWYRDYWDYLGAHEMFSDQRRLTKMKYSI